MQMRPIGQIPASHVLDEVKKEIHYHPPRRSGWTGDESDQEMDRLRGRATNAAILMLGPARKIGERHGKRNQ